MHMRNNKSNPDLDPSPSTKLLIDEKAVAEANASGRRHLRPKHGRSQPVPFASTSVCGLQKRSSLFVLEKRSLGCNCMKRILKFSCPKQKQCPLCRPRTWCKPLGDRQLADRELQVGCRRALCMAAKYDDLQLVDTMPEGSPLSPKSFAPHRGAHI